jgi:hypothetical protein
MKDRPLLTNREALIYGVWRAVNRTPRVRGDLTLDGALRVVEELFEVVPRLKRLAAAPWTGLPPGPRRKR